MIERKETVSENVDKKVRALSTAFLDSIEESLLKNINNGGDGVGSRITNSGVFEVHYVTVSEKDVDAINRALDGI